MLYKPEDGKWQVGPQATEIHRLQATLSREQYAEQKQAFKEFMCNYFSTGTCANSQGSSISPVGSTPLGGKVLKVRWAYPGCGKSGSLRLAVVAYCDAKRVHIAGAFPRKDDPSDSEFMDAVSDL